MSTYFAFLKKFAKWSVASAMVAVVLLTSGLLTPSAAVAVDVKIPLAAVPPTFPCVTPTTECHFYEQQQEILKAINEKVLRTWQFAVGTALLNGLSYFTERIAIDMAEWTLSGFKGGGPVFYRKGWDGFLEDIGKTSINVMITSMAKSDFLQEELGINICEPITLDLKLSLGLSRRKCNGQPDQPSYCDDSCGYAKIATNFEQTYRSLEPENLAENLRKSLQPGGNGVSIALSSNQKFLNEYLKKKEAQVNERIEGVGLKTLKSLISNQIDTPAQVLKDNMRVTNVLDLTIKKNSASAEINAMAAFQAGIEQLPMFAAGAFLNTLAVGLINKAFDLLKAGPEEDNIDLLDLDVQASAANTRGKNFRATLVSDIMVPNLITSDKQDLLFELSACSEPRGTWGCTLDDGFAQGLRSATENGAFTVSRAAGIGNDKGATTQKFLHPDWELIPETEAKDNQDEGCYQRAYCSSNLSKLRFARIIPVGWELAANSPFNKKVNGKYVTLGEVIRGYNVCNSAGQIDAAHPWCHLINPAWVLTAPNFRCELRGFGDTLVSANTPVRALECSDVTSCLKRNDKGECIGGYGACLSERTVWRFGADACEEKYASCRTYVTRQEGANAGKQVSFVRNTIDYGQCNSDNVGCLFYATTHDVTTTSTDKWISGAFPSADFKGTAIITPRVYFDSTVETCDASGDGCTRMLKATKGQSSLNLVRNGSFEELESAKKLGSWLSPDAAYDFVAYLPSSGAASVEGAQGAQFGSRKGLEQSVVIQPLRNYVLSFYARKTQATGGSVNVFVRLRKNISEEVSTPTTAYYRSANCTDTNAPQIKPGISVSTLPDEWTRYTCEFVSNEDARYALVQIAAANAGIDAVQLEEGDDATGYVEGLASNLPVTHMKLPPDELECTGDPKVDRAECANFARMCKQTDVGCQGYKEVGGTGTEIPATLNRTDYCPNSCVGYAQYQKLPTAFDLTQNVNEPDLNDPNDDSLAYFVPKNSNLCSAAAVGCEEFTNLESSAAGGENKDYFTYARACEKPNDNSRTYFTWEGSDVTGYQLRTWSLIKEQASNGPKILRKAGPDGVLKKPENCNEETWKTGADVDCRQFYDEAGAPFYRYFSQTVISSTSCVDYRKSASNSSDCGLTGGEYRADTKDCIYKVLKTESTSCQARDAGCRGYIGTTGRNTVTAYTQNFAGATSTGITAGDIYSTASISSESLLVGDYSLKVVNTVNSDPTVKIQYSAVTSSLYTVSFWAKKTTVYPTKISISRNANERQSAYRGVGSADLTMDWKRYEIGPFTQEFGGDGQTILATFDITAPSGVNYTGSQFFIDEIEIKRLQDVVYTRKDSWVIPTECDQTSEGIPQAQAMLGCREYRDRNGGIVDVHQFSHLCRFDAVGCSAFVNTQNSASPYEESFAMKGGPAPVGDTTSNPPGKSWEWLYAQTVTTTRPADRFEYLIDEPSGHCNASQASCRAFGKPKFSQYVIQDEFETVYLKDNIEKYVDDGGEPSMLCRPSELFCDKFVSGPVTSFFRDPAAMGDHTCEWKDRILINDTTTLYGNIGKNEYSGWFVRGTEMPCYPEKLSSGNTFITEFTGSPNYRGWTEICPREQSECTEFRDPNDHTDQAHPAGRSYFFIANERLDTKSCAGKVDLYGGCVLFRDTSISELLFSTNATYAKSKADNDNPTGAVNCAADPTNPYCARAGVCTDVRCDPAASTRFACTSLTSTGKPTYYDQAAALEGAACGTDADCVSDNSGAHLTGKCVVNNSNVIVKVKLDRDCQTWLGCSSAETVYDPSQGKYVDLCTNLQVCDQLAGSTAKNFCGHYLDRTPSAPVPNVGKGFYEPVLRQGRFFNVSTYVNRPTGFGDPDYSGYAIPNHFQISDLVTKRVAYDLLANRTGPIRDKFIHDYRLVTSVPLGSSDIGAAQVYVDQKYPYLNLCKHNQTGQVGYYVGNGPCYLAIDTPYSQNATEALGQSNVNPRNAQNAANAFEQQAHPELSQVLTEAFPRPECKAYPESSSPFPNNFVKKWNTNKYPPVPGKFADGYADSPYCEYGENCACSYRKVTYGATSKFYELFGNTPPVGVCQGGARNGEECVPGAVLAGNASSTAPAPAEGEPSNVSSEPSSVTPEQLCPGGTCEEISSVSLVRGVYGQCLQRDKSRIVGGSQENNPCFMWNPTPVLFGQSDIYHYQPTAGYLRPTNTGEYYCVASALPSKSIDVSADGDWLVAPGAMSDSQFYFHEDFVSDGDCVLCDGNYSDSDTEAPFVDGALADGGSMGSWCENADDDMNGGDILGTFNAGSLSNRKAGRWVQTGRGSGHSYAEYFIGIKEPQWAKWLYDLKDAPSDCSSASDSRACSSLAERNFASFTFSATPDPGEGLIGCGYTPNWVDGVSVDDYDDNDQLKKQTNKWKAGFSKDFPSIMGPESADYLRTEDGSELQKIPCKYADAKGVGGDDETNCFYKFWEVGYRADGQTKFRMQWDGRGGPKKFEKSATYYEKAEGGKSYFAIRAMFEDVNPEDNKVEQSEMASDGSGLTGPFRFVGWWVSAAAPGAASERAIYMLLTIGHSDICKEVAQVVAPATRDATPFMDRIQEDSGFSVPVIGATFDSPNPPYGSAKHSRPIGLSPLYQTNGKMPGALSKLRPPAFVASGLEYANSGSLIPSGNWAWLTNIFARVYRVYRWYDQVVGKDSWACVDGPRFGAWCPNMEDFVDIGDKNGDGVVNDADGGIADGVYDFGKTKGTKVMMKIDGTDYTSAQVSQKYCGYLGTCNTDLVDVTEAQPLCNSLSGVNAGLACSGDEGDQIQGYHTCHNAPMKRVRGQLVPQYVACELQEGWGQTGNTFYRTSATNEGKNRTEAAALGAMKCANTAVHYPDGSKATCSRVQENSSECPLEVRPGTDSSCVNEHCNNGYEHTQCKTNQDCRFTWIEWWNNGKDFPMEYPVNLNIRNQKSSFYLGLGDTLGYIDEGDNHNPTSNYPADNHWYQNIPDSDSSPVWWDGGGGEDSSDGVKDGLDIAGKSFAKEGARYMVYGNSVFENGRFPGAYIALDNVIDNGNINVYIPGHCERPPVEDVPGKHPYNAGNYRGPQWAPGICEAGAYEGSNCNREADCGPPGLDPALQASSANYCRPVNAVSTNGTYTPTGMSICNLKAVAEWKNPSGPYTFPDDCVQSTLFNFSCNDSAGDPKSKDLDKDNNLCTHNAGYYPRADLCGNTTNRPECLTAYTHNNVDSIGKTVEGAVSMGKPPTDVTNGLYTLDYLAQKNNDPSKFASFDQRYITYYTPRPPTLAAPDTSHSCPAAGQCPISRINGFSLENQAEGSVAYVGGQAITSIRFYAWAADNQGPLKDIIVDWGDGSLQEFHDAKMKNKKPFCGVSTQCELVPGLTCRSDNDCPPAAGKCIPKGFCKAKPAVECSKDTDCASGSLKDVCTIRTTFGNTEEGCEQNYYEYTHAFSCSQDQANGGLPACGTSSRCSRDPARTCTSNSGCAAGDTCLANLAPPNGCFDATKSSCRFTPRVLVKDNWGWCAGECRVQNLGNNVLGSGFTDSGSTASNKMLYSNGGCYDATGVYKTEDPTASLAVANTGSTVQNSCDPSLPSGSHLRPWIVYPGALQLGVSP